MYYFRGFNPLFLKKVFLLTSCVYLVRQLSRDFMICFLSNKYIVTYIQICTSLYFQLKEAAKVVNFKGLLTNRIRPYPYVQCTDSYTVILCKDLYLCAVHFYIRMDCLYDTEKPYMYTDVYIVRNQENLFVELFFFVSSKTFENIQQFFVQPFLEAKILQTNFDNIQLF